MGLGVGTSILHRQFGRIEQGYSSGHRFCPFACLTTLTKVPHYTTVCRRLAEPIDAAQPWFARGYRQATTSYRSNNFTLDTLYYLTYHTARVVERSGMEWNKG